MWHVFNKFKQSHLQTKFFILTLALYLMTLMWTTAQAYARLEYHRADSAKPIFIQPPIDQP